MFSLQAKDHAKMGIKEVKSRLKQKVLTQSHAHTHKNTIIRHMHFLIMCETCVLTCRSLQRMVTQKSLAPPSYPPHTAKTPSPGTRDVQLQFTLDRWVWGIITDLEMTKFY